MNREFIKQFFENRDNTLLEIKENTYQWNRFVIYWSKIFEKYSVDNILNLYFYNSSGSNFMTFDEWNSEDIGRRIKPKSKGMVLV